MTQQFLNELGFTPENPPNAAIVAQRESGDEQEILVVELLKPVYDANAGILTYDARVLADYGEHGLAHLAHQQQDYELGETFGAGSLFIDDCPDAEYACLDSETGTQVGTISCWHCYSGGSCTACDLPHNLHPSIGSWDSYGHTRNRYHDGVPGSLASFERTPDARPSDVFYRWVVRTERHRIHTESG